MGCVWLVVVDVGHENNGFCFGGSSVYGSVGGGALRSFLASQESVRFQSTRHECRCPREGGLVVFAGIVLLLYKSGSGRPWGRVRSWSLYESSRGRA